MRSSVIPPSEKEMTWSSSVYASRRDPVASLAIQMSARSSASTPRSLDASMSLSLISAVEIMRKLYCWQRDLIVAGTLWTSVVAKMKTM